VRPYGRYNRQERSPQPKPTPCSFWWNRLDSPQAADYNPLARLKGELAVTSEDIVAMAQAHAARAKN